MYGDALCSCLALPGAGGTGKAAEVFFFVISFVVIFFYLGFAGFHIGWQCNCLCCAGQATCIVAGRRGKLSRRLWLLRFSVRRLGCVRLGV